MSFGLSAFHSFSEAKAEQSAEIGLVDHSHADLNAQDVDCEGHEKHCNFDKTQHSHAGHCCPLPNLVTYSGPTGLKNILTKMVVSNLIETVSAPPLRPPRFFA